MNINNIRKITKGAILKNESMARHTTFRIGGPADYYIIPLNTKELSGLIRYFAINRIDYYVIGNGSNLLVSDKGYRGVIIDLGRNDGTAFSMLGYDDSGEDLIMDLGAGCLMSAVGSLSARFGGTGFEELSGIPGCIGGAVVMNAGAFDREMKDVLLKVEAVDRKGNILELNKDELGLRYRGSRLMDEGLIVTRAEIALKKGNTEEINNRIEEFKKLRQEKQPVEYPSAGSVFKRPEGHFAGKLISDAGLKGLSVGDACVSEKHAGFIINKGTASAMDVYRLINMIRDKVSEQFGVCLEPEVKFLGEF